MRKLATIRTISDIQPIEGADAIEVATVDGWKVVTKKGDFIVGDTAIYLEIDSWVPTEIAPFLTKDGHYPKEYNGVKGERLKTVKLRGQISQGLLLHYHEYPAVFSAFHKTRLINPDNPNAPFDVTELLGIQKWEAPISPQLEGTTRGNFPTHLVPKTDEERIQNMFKGDLIESMEPYEVSMKLDGSSMTVFVYENELRVCSRNLELKVEDDSTNTFVKVAKELNLPENVAFQGELMGPGVQGNRENLDKHQFFVFNAYHIDSQQYLTPNERHDLCEEYGLTHVPILSYNSKGPESVAEALEYAEGPSLNHKIREGVVFKSIKNPEFSFKCISNKFLLKGGN